MKTFSAIFENSSLDEEKDCEISTVDMVGEMVGDVVRALKRNLPWCRPRVKKSRHKSSRFDNHFMTQDKINRWGYSAPSGEGCKHKDQISGRTCTCTAAYEEAFTNKQTTSDRRRNAAEAKISIKQTGEHKVIRRHTCSDFECSTCDVPENQMGMTKRWSESSLFDTIKNKVTPRIRNSTVGDRVAVHIARQRKEIEGMTCSERVKYFRAKYGLNR